MKIRKINIDDAGGIAKVHVDTWKACYKGIVPDNYLDSLNVEKKAKDWRAGLQKGLDEGFVAQMEDEIIGWVTFGKNRDNQSDHIFELYGLYVQPTYWGTEVGFTLFNKAIKHLKLNFPKKITLWVLEDNFRARAFYEKNGFKLNQTQKEIEIGDKILLEIQYEIECSLNT